MVLRHIDRPLRLRQRAPIVLAALVILAVAWLTARSPAAIEGAYARGLSFQLSRALSFATALLPVSVAELSFAGLALAVLVLFVKATSQIVRRERSVLNAIAGGALRLAMIASVIAALFYTLWGLNYARAPLAERLGWTVDIEAGRAAEEEVATLATQLLEATNAAYREVAGADDLGRPTGLSGEAAALDAALETAFGRVQVLLGLEPQFAATRGRAKPFLASAVMNHLALAGFYFPLTGEANYNRLQPAPSLPQSIAHEKAHQRGIAREDEAGFIGYLACVMGDDPYARYSGYLFASRQLLGELSLRDPRRAGELLAHRLPGVQRDVDFIRAFWQQYDGVASRVSESVNDRYLKSQGERRGTRSYAASRNLIVLFARHNGGDARRTERRR